MRVGIAADHEGYELKKQVIHFFERTDFEMTDFGATVFAPDDDYPDFIVPLAIAVSHAKMQRGIAICGSGIGACIASNKVRNVRAAIAHDPYSARQGVRDDDMNILCLGAKVISFPTAIELIDCFLNARFSKLPRHKRRLAKVSKLEETEIQHERKPFTQAS